MMEINRPEIVAEITIAFDRYHDALVNNKVWVLDELFWDSPNALRYGVSENLYGYDQIQSFRASRPTEYLERTILRTAITTYGKEFATVNVEFQRTGSTKITRQSQTWIRTDVGWRVAAAHVSLMN
ncbi:MAG: hypothetical protein JWQ23_4364 [Herminiimonas sp.]|jgi:hypothetical protein|nr:hypothetical protein [Herminiimonas sp.]